MARHNIRDPKTGKFVKTIFNSCKPVLQPNVEKKIIVSIKGELNSNFSLIKKCFYKIKFW